MFDIQYFEELESTMDIAREKAVKDKVVCEGIIIQAGIQTSGRGRRGNEWSSPKGNLYQSIILKPKTSRDLWGQLSFVIAIALSQSCMEVGIDRQDINLKWPNDVLINGKKLAGILIEAGDDFVIIGTGINILACPKDKVKINDYSQINRDDFRDVFLKYIEYYYNQWQEVGFVPIRKKWMEHAYKIHETIQARLSNVIYEGTFEGLDDMGVLLLREKNGCLRKINSGEIITCF